VNFGSLWDIFWRGCFAAALLYYNNLVFNLWQFVLIELMVLSAFFAACLLLRLLCFWLAVLNASGVIHSIVCIFSHLDAP